MKLFVDDMSQHEFIGRLIKDDLNPLDLAIFQQQLNQAEVDAPLLANSYCFIKDLLLIAKQHFHSEWISNFKSDNITALTAYQNPLYSDKQFINNTLNPVPSWLQNIAESVNCQSEICIKLYDYYLRIRNEYEPSKSHPRYAEEFNIFACAQMSLALLPRMMFAEIIGFSLAHSCLMSMPPNPPPFIHVKTTLEDFITQNDKLTASQWDAIQNGFWLYHYCVGEYYRRIQETFDESVGIEETVRQIFISKAQAARGHHANIKLQGIGLDEWFSKIPNNSHDFMHALGASDYIDRKQAENSRLLKLFAFNGPMFGILNDDELASLRAWIIAGRPMTHNTAKVNEITRHPFKQATLQHAVSDKKLHQRHLYHALLNIDLYPEILPIAHQKLVNQLRFCRFVSSPPFKRYDEQRFIHYIENRYRSEMDAYQPASKPRFSKPAYIWAIEQIAPMVLIDGCWLQKAHTLPDQYAEIRQRLMRIYNDELGCGILQQNHPHIFSTLLNSLNIALPPVNSLEFIHHQRFLDSAFDLPVFMLAMSYCPIEFLPELLGLNMAIELSGLGKDYMRLVDDWRHWDIDAKIAEIHITIDNYADGHARLAQQTIQLYLRDLWERSHSQSTVDQHWKRIYTGFNSLQIMGKRFSLMLPCAYLFNQ